MTRETLLALTVHNATSPTHLQAKGLLGVARDIIGYGIPAAPARILEADDSGITIVVQTTLLPGQEHKLEFAWPASLARDGKCRGYARLTLVTRPVLAYQHGQERVRINLDARLMQQQADGSAGWSLKILGLENEILGSMPMAMSPTAVISSAAPAALLGTQSIRCEFLKIRAYANSFSQGRM